MALKYLCVWISHELPGWVWLLPHTEIKMSHLCRERNFQGNGVCGRRLARHWRPGVRNGVGCLNGDPQQVGGGHFVFGQHWIRHANSHIKAGLLYRGKWLQSVKFLRNFRHYRKVFQKVHSSLQKYSGKMGREPQKRHASRKTKVFRQETDKMGILR